MSFILLKDIIKDKTMSFIFFNRDHDWNSASWSRAEAGSFLCCYGEY